MKKMWVWLALGVGVFYVVLKGKSAAAAAMSAQAQAGKGVTATDLQVAENAALQTTGNVIEAFVLDLAARFVQLKALGNTKYEASRDVWKPLTAENVRETLYASMIRQGGTAQLWMGLLPQVEAKLAQLR